MYEIDIQVDDEFLKPLYEKEIRNLKATYSFMTSDSGFDLFFPKDVTLRPGEQKLIDLKVKCQPKFAGGFYIYPRSSLSKTPLIMVNSVGIIDNQYRGTLKVPVKNISDKESYEIKAGYRLFQICHPTLIKPMINLVEKVDPTIRNEGGFGSTGK